MDLSTKPDWILMVLAYGFALFCCEYHPECADCYLQISPRTRGFLKDTILLAWIFSRGSHESLFRHVTRRWHSLEPVDQPAMSALPGLT
jgi:hypothetical protein